MNKYIYKQNIYLNTCKFWYLNNNIYSFIGSDAHRDKGRNTDIKNVIKILEYNQRKSFINNGKAMLKNEEIEFRGIPIKEKKFLGIF